MTKKKNYPLSTIHYPFKSGFTLIELMISMVIIALLVLVGYGMYLNSLRRGQDARRQGDMKAFQNAMEQYYAVNQAYPADLSAAAALFPGSVMPKDPVNTGTFVYSFPTINTAAYCGCAQLKQTITGGNSSNPSCTYVASGSYFCVSNLQ